MQNTHRYRADSQNLYFITSATVHWLPIFLSHRYFSILTDALTFCRRNRGLLLYAYVLMPDHFHIIASTEASNALPGIMRDLKRHTSREVTRCLGKDDSWALLQIMAETAIVAHGGNGLHVWQESCHPVPIFTQKFLHQKLDFLHGNPVREGYVRAAGDWVYSSAGEYATGQAGVLEIDRLEL